jgi:hypothetical protein
VDQNVSQNIIPKEVKEDEPPQAEKQQHDFLYNLYFDEDEIELI